MIAYVDSSVLLRIVLGEPRRLRVWSRITSALSSELIRIECLRTIDRARLRLGLHDDEVAYRRAEILERLRGFDLVRFDACILARAADPFPTGLGTLDALHLATAVRVREREASMIFATHDAELATAARALGFRVHGAPE